MSRCDEMRQLLGGHALGALDPADEAALHRHLAVCEDCRRESGELARVAGLLDIAESTEAPEEPPPALEQALLDSFARERRALTPAETSRRLWPRRRALALAGAAAAALLVAGVVGAVAGLDGGGDRAPSRAASTQVELYGDTRASGSAELRAVPAGTRVRMRVAGLPARPSPVYEVWCIRDDGRWISGGTFRVDEHGSASLSLTTAARPGEYETVRVTRRAGRGYGPSLLRGHVSY